MSKCNICPRECGANRDIKAGYCGEKNDIRVARIAPHHFEEPVISGTRGSGTVFFSGCSLGCVFCQNRDISRRGGAGQIMSADELYLSILKLADSGVHNINLVTSAHFIEQIIPILERLKSSAEFRIPIVYNSSGYEKEESLKRLEGLVDIYLPDVKYFSPEIAQKYSCAPDYPQTAFKAVAEMYRQIGKYSFSEKEPDILQKGVIVRHLVLPGCRKDSIEVLRTLTEILPKEDILVSIMSQYTPDFAMDCSHKNLRRRLTRFEYESVTDYAAKLGINGFIQELSSAKKDFTPDFSESNNL